MKVTEHITRGGAPKVSFEILPPTKGSSIKTLYEALDPLMEFQPACINITNHQPEIEYWERPDGLLKRRIVSKRPGTVAIAAAIMNHYQVDVVPHLICGGFSREETENALIDLHYLGIQNILLLRGDAHPSTGRFIPDKNGHEHTIDLVRQVIDLNRGVYLDQNLPMTEPTDFCTGVAGYPEKHIEAPNAESDLTFLKVKVDAGAEYIVTQMFFDNSKFFRFVEACREIGITVPIIPGLKPISIKKHLNLLPQSFKVDIPPALSKELVRCETNEAVRQVGIEWSIQQAHELIHSGVSMIHFFTMGRTDNIRKIVSSIF
jgi:methylenetetrahydrofolate reductase (NADPH)